MSGTAEIIVSVPLAASSNTKGSRLVVIDAAYTCHVLFSRSDDSGTVEFGFTAEEAVRIAHQVLAGEARVCTAPNTLRLLAAAFLVSALEKEEPVGQLVLP